VIGRLRRSFEHGDVSAILHDHGLMILDAPLKDGTLERWMRLSRSPQRISVGAEIPDKKGSSKSGFFIMSPIIFSLKDLFLIACAAIVFLTGAELREPAQKPSSASAHNHRHR